VGDPDGAGEVDTTVGEVLASVDQDEIWIVDAFGKPVGSDE
jgi:hypothetical protein